MFTNVRLPGKIDNEEIWVEYEYNNNKGMGKYNPVTKVYKNLYNNDPLIANPSLKGQFDKEVAKSIMEKKLT